MSFRSVFGILLQKVDKPARSVCFGSFPPKPSVFHATSPRFIIFCVFPIGTCFLVRNHRFNEHMFPITHECAQAFVVQSKEDLFTLVCFELSFYCFSCARLSRLEKIVAVRSRWTPHCSDTHNSAQWTLPARKPLSKANLAQPAMFTTSCGKAFSTGGKPPQPPVIRFLMQSFFTSRPALSVGGKMKFEDAYTAILEPKWLCNGAAGNN